MSCCCCCWPRSTGSGSKKGRRNLWHAFLKCFRKLCGCRKSLVRVAPEEEVSEVQIQDILRKHTYSPPKYRERLFLRPKEGTKGSHSFQTLAQVHRSWQHDLETVEELPETPSQIERSDSSECIPTDQEPSQTGDSTEADSKAPSQIELSDSSECIPTDQEPSQTGDSTEADSKAPSQIELSDSSECIPTDQEPSQTGDSTEADSKAPSQIELSDSSECIPTDQEPSQTGDSTEADSKGEDTGESASLWAIPQEHAPPAGELGPSKTIQDAAGTPEDLELTASLKGQLDIDQGPSGGPQAPELTASLVGEPGQGLEDSGQPVGGELPPPLLGEADPDPPPAGCPEAATMTPPQQVEPGPDHQDVEYTEVVEFQL